MASHATVPARSQHIVARSVFTPSSGQGNWGRLMALPPGSKRNFSEKAVDEKEVLDAYSNAIINVRPFPKMYPHVQTGFVNPPFVNAGGGQGGPGCCCNQCENNRRTRCRVG